MEVILYATETNEAGERLEKVNEAPRCPASTGSPTCSDNQPGTQAESK